MIWKKFFWLKTEISGFRITWKNICQTCIVVSPTKQQKELSKSSSGFVGGQEHSPIRVRAQRVFFVLREQVLVFCSEQELGPIAEKWTRTHPASYYRSSTE
jgi:hypothetical protein